MICPCGNNTFEIVERDCSQLITIKCAECDGKHQVFKADYLKGQITKAIKTSQWHLVGEVVNGDCNECFRLTSRIGLGCASPCKIIKA